MTRKGIDVSHWQGTIDWNKVKKAGIEFAIIKAGGSDAGFYTDSRMDGTVTKSPSTCRLSPILMVVIRIFTPR